MYVLHSISIFCWNFSVFFYRYIILLHRQKTILNYFVCIFFACVCFTFLLYYMELNWMCLVANMVCFSCRFLIWSYLWCIVLWSYSGLQGRKQNQVPMNQLSKECQVFLPGLSISISQLFWTTFVLICQIFYLDLSRGSNWVNKSKGTTRSNAIRWLN